MSRFASPAMNQILERTQTCQLQVFSPTREEVAECIAALLDTHLSMSAVVDEERLQRAIRDGTDHLVHVARQFSASSSSIPLQVRPVFAKTIARTTKAADNEQVEDQEEEEEYGLSGVVSQLDIFLRWTCTSEETVNLVMQRDARTQEPLQVTVRTTTHRHELKAVRLHLHQAQLHVTKVSSAPVVHDSLEENGESFNNDNEEMRQHSQHVDDDLFDSAIFQAVGATQQEQDDNHHAADLFLGETIVPVDEQQQQQQQQQQPNVLEDGQCVPIVVDAIAEDGLVSDNDIVYAPIVGFFRPTDEGWDFDYVGDGTVTDAAIVTHDDAPPALAREVAEGCEDVPRAMSHSVQQLLESQILPKLELQVGEVFLTTTTTNTNDDQSDIFRMDILGALYQEWMSKLQVSSQVRTVDMTTTTTTSGGMSLGNWNAATPGVASPPLASSSEEHEATTNAPPTSTSVVEERSSSPLFHVNKLTLLIKSCSSSLALRSEEAGSSDDSNDDAEAPGGRVLLEATDMSIKEGQIYAQDLHMSLNHSLDRSFSLSWSGVWCTLPPTSKRQQRQGCESGQVLECRIRQIHKLELNLGSHLQMRADPQVLDKKRTTSIHYDGFRWTVECPTIVLRVVGDATTSLATSMTSLPLSFLTDLWKVPVRLKFRQLTVLLQGGDPTNENEDEQETAAATAPSASLNRFNFFRLDMECMPRTTTTTTPSDHMHAKNGPPVMILLVRRLDVLDYNGWLQCKEMLLRVAVRKNGQQLALDQVRLVVPSTRVVLNGQSRAWFHQWKTASRQEDDGGPTGWQSISMEFARLYTPSIVVSHSLTSESVSLRQELVGDGLTTLGELSRRYWQWIHPALQRVEQRQAEVRSDLADSAAVTVGSMALGVAISTPVGLAASVAAVGVKDAMVSAAAAGKESRGATAQDSYQWGDVSRGTVAAAVTSVTAAGKQQRGASAQDSYRFGDWTRGLSSNLGSAVESATAAGKASRGGSSAEGYQFGDFTRGVFSSAFRKSSSSSQTEETSEQPKKKIWNDSEKVGKLAGSSVGAAVGLGLGGPVGLLAGAYLGARAGRGVATQQSSGTDDHDHDERQGGENQENNERDATSPSTQPESIQEETPLSDDTT